MFRVEPMLDSLLNGFPFLCRFELFVGIRLDNFCWSVQELFPQALQSTGADHVTTDFVLNFRSPLSAGVVLICRIQYEINSIIA